MWGNVKSRPDQFAKAPAYLAIACVGFLASAPAIAAEADDLAAEIADDDQAQSDRIVVTGEVYQTKQESPKATRSLRDTPQTVTVITGETIEQQNLLTLRDVLTTVPGITFGAGEGGGGYGDSIVMRGFSANTDITQDGVRDSAQYSRSDSFNLEQLEVVNGSNSVYGGSGSVGGSINIVTKRPLTTDRVLVSGGVGTHNYYRGAIDANQRVSDLVAVRLNAMFHHNDIPGRDWEENKRWGVAPSFTFGVGQPTSVTLQYLHQEDNNVPSYGVPYHLSATNNGPLPGIDSSNYYGYRNVDTQDINIDQATVIVEHELSDTVSLRNLSRWQDVRQFAIVGPPQGTFCLPSGLLGTGAACPSTVPAGYYQPSGPRGTTRDSRNELLFNQIDLRAAVDTGGVAHTIVLGAAYSGEKYFLASGNSLRNPNGSVVFPTLPLINIADPDNVITGPAGFTYGSNVYAGPINFIPTQHQNGRLENVAVYLFDTMKLTEQLELNAGARFEYNDGWYRADTVSADAATLGQITPGTRFDNSDELFSYRVGLVYKPIEAISIYAAYGNSKTPSKTSVNGSCSDVTCNVKPETAMIYELGAKAEVAEGRLLLSASLFKNVRDQYKVATGDPLEPEQQLDGKARVNGIALSAVGQITHDWNITANYTYLDSQVIRSIALNSPPGTVDPQAGNPLTNTPRHSGSVFTTYRLPGGLRVGYSATYQGSFFINNAAGDHFRVPDYLVHNAFAEYAVSDRLALQLNVKNFTGEKYYTRVRNNAAAGVAWAMPGEARSAVLTANLTL
jgi:catecholate siderophore receptor